MRIPQMRVPQFRLLPVTIFVALLMFMVRANDIWRGVMSGNIGSTAMAQSGEPRPPRSQAPQIAAKPMPQLAPQVAESQPVRSSATATTKAPQVAVAAEETSASAESTGNAGELSSTLTQNEIELLQKLAERREELEQRGRELDMREGLLKAAETRIDKKIGELKNLQTAIDALIKKHNEQEDAKMQSLVKIYENMKPKDAARIFEELDMPILLDVVERMSERRIAPILAEMDPSKAKAVTSEMAQRRQLPTPSATNG